MKPTFKIGDVVALKSGYVDMTVVEVGVVTKKVRSPSGVIKKVNDEVVSCVWQDPTSAKLHKGTFPAAALQMNVPPMEPGERPGPDQQMEEAELERLTAPQPPVLAPAVIPPVAARPAPSPPPPPAAKPTPAPNNNAKPVAAAAKA